MIESAARANGLPVDFVTRIIWRESRFDPGAVGPRTRSGARAEGIAQFMPQTAAERALDNPFDPIQALPQAAAFLRELRDMFGNLGLAAAAYNAGPGRVWDWLAGRRGLPAETRRYVYAITGRSVDEWSPEKKAVANNSASCSDTLAALKAPPNAFAYQLEQRVAAAMDRPWAVELAAGFSRDKVLSAYARALAKLGQTSGDHDAIITRAILRSRGTSAFYKAQIGFETRSKADALCGTLRAAGGACFVTRERGSRTARNQADRHGKD